MTEKDLPRYRYWGNQKPNAKLATLRVATAVLDEQGDPTVPTAAEDNPTVAVLRLLAPIDSWGGWFGVSAEEFSVALDQLPPSIATIILRINSPGGEVPEAMTILNMLRAHKARVIAVVDGWAVSAASFLAVGCDETVMSPGTQMMIHDARIFACGDPTYLRKTAARLDSDSDNIASIYVEAAGGDEPAWRALMGPETWYTAKEAVTAGLADRVAVVPDAGISDTPGADDPEIEDGRNDDGPENVFDLSMYRYAGRNQAPAPAAAARRPKPPSASAIGSNRTKEGSPAVSFNDKQLTDMRQKLGVAEDADEATILAALDEALDEQTQPTPPTTATAPEGKVLISKAEWDETRGDAQRGSAAAKELHDMKRTKDLDDRRDKFLPANRETWEDEYDRDPKATKEALDKRQVVIPLDEMGHEVDADNGGEKQTVVAEIREDPNYKNWEM